MIKTAKQAIASHWEMDLAEVNHYRMNECKYNGTVYCIDNEYYWAGKKTPRATGDYFDELKWEEIKNEFINRDGWKIFKAEPSEE